MAVNYALSNRLDTAGEWFLPSEPERRVGGNFSWTPEGADLNLLDSIPAVSFSTNTDDLVSTHEAIHGLTREELKLTLLKPACRERDSIMGEQKDRFPERYLSSSVVIGGYVDSGTKYLEMQFRIPGLDIWLSRPIVKKSMETNPEGQSTGTNYKVERSAEEDFALPSIDSSIVFSTRSRTSNDNRSKISIEITAWVRVRPREPQNLEWFITQAKKVTIILSFLAASPMSFDCVRAKLAGERATDVSILLASRSKYCRYKDPREFFLTRSTMGIELSDVLIKWFSSFDALSNTSQLALSIMYLDKPTIHMEFLTYMQALEGFHRATIGGVYMDKAAYEPIRKLLSDAIPSDLNQAHKDALKSKIRYGYEFSLSRRLNDLVSGLDGSLLKKIIGGSGSIPRAWIDTRNYYTHWDDTAVDSVLGTMEMHEAGVRMKLLLRFFYLVLVGIPQSVIEGALEGHSDEALYLMQLNRAG